MILAISIIAMVIIYLLLRCVYEEYKKTINDIDDYIGEVINVKLTELERKNNMNEQMINALWEEVAEKKLKEQKAKEKKDKK